MIDEISVHKLKTFKQCRRMYQLKYVEKLESNVSIDALESGKLYHGYIDDFFKGEEIHGAFTKEYAMFLAFKKYIYPVLEQNLVRMVDVTEKKMKYRFAKGKRFVGILDGMGHEIATNEDFIIEHKTTSESDFEKYEYMLQWDEQILAYMMMTGYRKVLYTVCRKPTIRQKQNESDEEFFGRMVAWYAEDTDNKVRVFTITRTDEEVAAFERDVVTLSKEMKTAEKTGNFYRNTCACNSYNRICEYASICLNYDPEQASLLFHKRESVDFSNGEETNKDKIKKGEQTLWNF